MAIFQTTSSTQSNSIFKKKTTSSSGSIFKSASNQQSEIDYEKLAEVAGIKKPETPKLSMLRRATSLLSSLETGNAVYTGLEQKNALAGIGSYVTGVGKGIASAVTGRDYGQTNKKTYGDIVEKYGVTNKVAKFGLGLAGDILLDPSTYVGGSIVKGGVKATSKVSSFGLKTLGKFAPETEKGLRMAGKGIKDAAGNAFVYGYGTTKGLTNKVLETDSVVNKATQGIVESNVRRISKSLSKTEQDELRQILLEAKRVEFKIGKGTDEGIEAGMKIVQKASPNVKKVIEAQIPRSKKFAKIADVDEAYNVYYPGISKEKIENFDKVATGLKVGQQGYKKQFKDLLKDEDIISNPAEAFARREVEVVSDKIIGDQLRSMVKQFGRGLDEFVTKDEALRAGYSLVREKGKFGKELGYMLDADKKFIDGAFSKEFSTIDKLAKATGYDAVTSLFKRSVTGLFPSFHVRNYVSGMIQNYETLGTKALSPTNVAWGHRISSHLARQKVFKDEIINIGGKTVPLKTLVKPFEKRFGTSSQYIKDIADATSTRALTKTKSLNPLSSQAVHFRAARAVGNFIETQQKATAYIAAIRSGKSVDEALELATRAGFDYRALTQFESKVLRRLIPFYSFTRKNIELQLRTLGENPERIGNIINLLENAGNVSEEEREGLPDYAQENFAIKTGTSKNGLPEIASGLGTPIEQITNLFGKNPVQKIAATLNPVFKVPLERAFGKDFFRDRDLKDVVQAGEYSNMPQPIKDFLQVKEYTETKKDGTKKTVYNANPYRLQLLRSLPTTRGASYAAAIFDDKTETSKALYALTGIKPKEIDIETVEYFRNRDRQRELEDLLIQSGILKRFEKTFTPKNIEVKN